MRDFIRGVLAVVGVLARAMIARAAARPAPKQLVVLKSGDQYYCVLGG